MEPLLMMKTATVLLTVSALGGLVMAGIRFSGQPHPPSWLAMLYGFLSVAALTLLLYAYFTVGLPGMAQLALLLFLVAALGGVFMNLGYHVKNLPLPKGIVLGHAALAVCGYVLLATATWRMSQG